MNKELNNIIIWAQNKTGVLYRILWLLRRKLFNIESITAGHSEIPDITRITITVLGDNDKVKNICHQLYKLVEVVKVEQVENRKLVFREMAMMKVLIGDKQEKNDVLRTIEHFRGRVINMAKDSLVIEVTGDESKINAFYENMKDFNILEFVRT